VCHDVSRCVTMCVCHDSIGREFIKYTVIYGIQIRFWPTLHRAEIPATSLSHLLQKPVSRDVNLQKCFVVLVDFLSFWLWCRSFTVPGSKVAPFPQVVFTACVIQFGNLCAFITSTMYNVQCADALHTRCNCPLMPNATPSGC